MSREKQNQIAKFKKYLILVLLPITFIVLAIWSFHDGSSGNIDVSYGPPLCSDNSCTFTVVLQNFGEQRVEGKATIRSTSVSQSITGSSVSEVFQQQYVFDIEGNGEYIISETVEGITSLPNFKVHLKLNPAEQRV